MKRTTLVPFMDFSLSMRATSYRVVFQVGYWKTTRSLSLELGNHAIQTFVQVLVGIHLNGIKPDANLVETEFPGLPGNGMLGHHSGGNPHLGP